MTDPAAAERFAGPDAISLLVVDGGPTVLAPPGCLPVVVCAIGDRFGGAGPEHADLVVAEHDVDELATAIARNPLSATTLALLLRSTPFDDVDRALAIESATYSMLQAGTEHRAWLATAPGPAAPDRNPVIVHRADHELTVELNRPGRHNAISTGLRDALYDALSLAVVDDTIERVTLRGAGPSFCSGGDLADFGQQADPTEAHRIRLARSPARLLHRVGQKTVVELHGAALGGGIEMAAFARHIVAQPDVIVALPEIGIGLIPGAGGTVSLPRRIGRQRTAALGLTGRRIDATTALEWGLIDAVEGG